MLRMLTRRIYLNYTESKDPRKSLATRQLDLDTVIGATQTGASFESTRVSDAINAVAGYPATTSEREMASAARVIADESQFLPWVLNFVIDDLKRASILGFSPFVNDYFPAKHVASKTATHEAYVPDGYRFDVKIRDRFRGYVKSVDEITWTDLGDGVTPGTHHEANEWRFGACAHREQFDVVSELVQGWGPTMLVIQHLNFQYSDLHTFVPDYGRSSKWFRVGISTPKLFLKGAFTFGMNTMDNAVDGDKPVQKFDQWLGYFLGSVKRGFCDDPSSRAMKIFRNQLF